MLREVDARRYGHRPRTGSATSRLGGTVGRCAPAARPGADEEGSWIVTAGLAGQSAVEERWKAQPALAVEAIGRGLRHFHDSLPVDECPFSWSAEQRVADAHTRAGTGELDPTRWHPDHRDLAVEGALGRIAEPPPVDRLVVCTRHLRPNTLLDEHGRFVGHVDLGSLGVADRWADLAIATWSTHSSPSTLSLS